MLSIVNKADHYIRLSHVIQLKCLSNGKDQDVRTQVPQSLPGNVHQGRRKLPKMV